MEGIGFALAKILSERSLRHNSGPIDFDTVQANIVEKAGISSEQAEALLWGEPVELRPEETERLADTFSLDGDLLACLLRPTSREILLHVLRSFRSDLDPSCSECAFLLSALEEIESMPRAELLQVCIDFLEHLSPAGEERVFAPGEENLLDIFRGLDASAQARVLAYVYNEKAQSIDNALPQRTLRLAELRSDFLPQTARRILDYLAHRGGSLPARDIATKIHQSEDVDDLPAVLDAALTEMALAGTPLDEDILFVSGRESGQISLSINPEVLPLWQSMLRADALFVDDNLLES